LEGSGHFLRGRQIQIRQKHLRFSLAHSPSNSAADTASTGDKNSFAIQAEITTIPFGHPSSLLSPWNFNAIQEKQKAGKGPLFFP
jgi:hypothetical protein